MPSLIEISFHNMPASAEIEALIRRRADKLAKIYPRLVRCRVSVEAPNRQPKAGIVPEIHVELQVPGSTLVVRRDHRARERHAAPDVRSSVRDAFNAATEKLLSYKDRQAREVKSHPAPLPAHISELFGERDYGFITTSVGKELYFHANGVMNAGFDSLKVGDEVQFIEADGDTGPMATKVWRLNGRER